MDFFTNINFSVKKIKKGTILLAKGSTCKLAYK